MILPLSFLLIFYLMFLAAYAVFSFFLFYHLIRYGVSGMTNLIIFAGYGAMTLFILAFTWYGVRGVNWSDPLFSFINTLP